MTELPTGFNLEWRDARPLSPPWWGSWNETIPPGWYWTQDHWLKLPGSLGPFADRVQAARSAWLNHAALQRPRATRHLVLSWGEAVLIEVTPSHPHPRTSAHA